MSSTQAKTDFSKKMTQTVLTIGTFDGDHRGHQKIFRRVREIARESHLEPLAVTFTLPPRLYFSSAKAPSLLSTVTEKRTLLEREGIAKILFFKFDGKFSQISAKRFFADFIVKQFRAKKIVVGYNFCFGKRREGNVATLRCEALKWGVGVEKIGPLKVKGDPISSGRIRRLLLEGDLKEANRLLGRPYFAMGKVVKGEGVGSNLGFPTVNLNVDPLKILPRGVFAVQVTRPKTGERFIGMCNVGVRPTVTGKKDWILGLQAGMTPHLCFEIHLLHFKGKLYGETLHVEFLKKLREERKFKTIGELKKQLIKDKKTAILFRKYVN